MDGGAEKHLLLRAAIQLRVSTCERAFHPGGCLLLRLEEI